MSVTGGMSQAQSSARVRVSRPAAFVGMLVHRRRKGPKFAVASSTFSIFNDIDNGGVKLESDLRVDRRVDHSELHKKSGNRILDTYLEGF